MKQGHWEEREGRRERKGREEEGKGGIIRKEWGGDRK